VPPRIQDAVQGAPASENQFKDIEALNLIPESSSSRSVPYTKKQLGFRSDISFEVCVKQNLNADLSEIITFDRRNV
jgi:hypothetical protein